jgi:hypothetical protein
MVVFVSAHAPASAYRLGHSVGVLSMAYWRKL